MKYHNDIPITEKQRPLTDDYRGADIYYQYDGETLKPELTWDTVCEQLNKPRFRDTGIRKSKFSLINESLSKHRRYR